VVDDSITGNLRAYGSARMSAPPEANTEYSRGSEASQPVSAHSDGRRARGGNAVLGVALTAALGALLILVSQFTALYHVHIATSSESIKTVGTGADHAWAPIPIALLAAALAFVLYRKRSRTALIALAVLGIVTLLIALLGDLPDAHATGIVGSGASQYAEGTSTPSAGLYMETLGAILLLISGGVGLLLLGAPPRPSEPTSEPAPIPEPAPEARDRIPRRLVLRRDQTRPRA
jgi:hypothetical protein